LLVINSRLKSALFCCFFVQFSLISSWVIKAVYLLTRWIMNTLYRHSLLRFTLTFSKLIKLACCSPLLLVKCYFV
jgi:hypothetical protein